MEILVGRIIEAYPVEGRYDISVDGKAKVGAYPIESGIVSTWEKHENVAVVKLATGYYILGRRWNPRTRPAGLDNEIDKQVEELNKATRDLLRQLVNPEEDPPSPRPTRRPDDIKTVPAKGEKVISNGKGVAHLRKDGSWLIRAAEFCFTLWDATRYVCQTVAKKMVWIVPGIKTWMEGEATAPFVGHAYHETQISPTLSKLAQDLIKLQAGFHPTALTTPGIELAVGQFLRVSFDANEGIYKLRVINPADPSGATDFATMQLDQTQIDLKTLLGQVTVTPEEVTIKDGESIISVKPESIDVATVSQTESATTRTVTDGTHTHSVDSYTQTVANARTVTVATGSETKNIAAGASTETIGAGAKTINVLAGAFVVNAVAGTIVLNSPTIQLQGDLDVKGKISQRGEVIHE